MGGQNKLRRRAREEMTGKHDRYRSTIFHDFMDMYRSFYGGCSPRYDSSFPVSSSTFVRNFQRSERLVQYDCWKQRGREINRNKGDLLLMAIHFALKNPTSVIITFPPFLWDSRKCLILIATIFTREIILFLCFPSLFCRILFLWEKKPYFHYGKVMLYR